MTIEENDKKLGELILYVSQQSASDVYFGSTKLNKILYFSDFIAYRNWDDKITGAEYFHLPQGPAPRRLVPVRTALIAAGRLQLQPVEFPDGKIQLKPVNIAKPDISIFQPRHISLVRSVIESLKGLTGTQTSNLSHFEVGWQITRKGETIDYGTVFLSKAPLTEPERSRALEIIREEEGKLAHA